MIIDDLDLVGVSVFPPETNTPLLIDPDPILTISVAGEFLQPISRGDPQITKRNGGVENQKFPQCRSPQSTIKFCPPFTEEEPFCILVAKASDHPRNASARR
jgi:hypothetical protein